MKDSSSYQCHLFITNGSHYLKQPRQNNCVSISCGLVNKSTIHNTLATSSKHYVSLYVDL